MSARSPRSQKIAAHYPGRLEVIAGDALGFDPAPELSGAAGAGRREPALQYRDPLLIRWLSAEPWPPWYDPLVLMFQREVAERIVAAAGIEDLWPALGADRMAHREPHPVRHRAFGLRAAAEGDVFAGRARAAPPRRCPATAGAGARHRSRLRPAPQDAAAKPEIPRRRSRCIAGGSRVSSQPRARSRFRWRVSSRWRAPLKPAADASLRDHSLPAARARSRTDPAGARA